MPRGAPRRILSRFAQSKDIKHEMKRSHAAMKRPKGRRAKWLQLSGTYAAKKAAEFLDK